MLRRWDPDVQFLEPLQYAIAGSTSSIFGLSSLRKESGSTTSHHDFVEYRFNLSAVY